MKYLLQQWPGTTENVQLKGAVPFFQVNLIVYWNALDVVQKVKKWDFV